MRRVLKFNPLVIIVTLVLILSSCAKEEFVANKKQESSASGGIWKNTATQCSSFTLIKPPVDFLFLWDNSSSQFLMNSQTKQALSNTLSKISERFDYRALMVPILGSSSTERHSQSFLIAENPDGISGVNIVSKEQAIGSLGTFSTVGGSNEPGLTSAKESLQYAINKGIFRRNAYTMVVLMSNGDDNGGYDNYYQIIDHATQKTGELLSVANSLSPLQFRFMTMVPHRYGNSCPGVGNAHASNAYIKASQIIHANAGNPSNDGKTSDSYDICGADFKYIFDGINNSIEDALVKHKYDYWPVLETNKSVIFDKSAIKVKKYSAGAEQILQENVHWELVDNANYVRTIDTCLEPAGCVENKTGYFIKLKGEGIVTYPECVVVETQDVLAHYGYIVLQAKPSLSSIKLIINGRAISQSSTNGWSYVGYKSSQNIRIVGPGNYNGGTPADLKAGYVLKLNGDSVYGNNSTVEVTYDPSSI